MTTNTPDMTTALDAFIAHAQGVINTHFGIFRPTNVCPTVYIDHTRHKYIRIIGGFKYAFREHRTVYCFIDSTNGNILKAASWKAPAKNFARGNIYDPTTWGCCGFNSAA